MGKKLRPVQTEVLLVGNERSIALPPMGISQSTKSFACFFSNLYFDEYRTEACLLLCSTISELASGTLEGQKNCFVGIGSRGVGLSQFFIGLGEWMTCIGDSNCAFLYRDMSLSKRTSLHWRSTTNIRKIVFSIAERLGWINLPSEPWEGIDKCWDWLIENQKRVLIVLDEFEATYQELNDCGLLSDMSSVGNRSGLRPLVIIALGSSAYLRSLCFCKGNLEHMLDVGYAGYKGRINLNETKFVPILFGPITTIDMTYLAMQCLALPLASRDTEADNTNKMSVFDVSHPALDIAEFCRRTRGQIREFGKVYRLMIDELCHIPKKTVSYQPKASYNHIYFKILKVLWQNIQQKLDSFTIARIAEYSEPFTRDIQERLRCPVSEFISCSVSIGDLYTCADNSLIRFDGSNYVYVLHPVDLETCVAVLGLESDSAKELSIAEEVSLLFSYNSSANEVKERLVAESLCQNGLYIPRLGTTLQFTLADHYLEHCNIETLRSVSKGHTHTAEPHSKIGLNAAKSLGYLRKGIFRNTIRPATLHKEFLDEFGADLIALFTVDNILGVRYIVVKIRIQLGLSCDSVDSKGISPIHNMKSTNSTYSRLLESDQGMFVNVLWTSRPTTARSYPSDENDVIIVINSDNMMDMWSDKCRRFVREHELEQYGFRVQENSRIAVCMG